jgi:endonuclease I
MPTYTRPMETPILFSLVVDDFGIKYVGKQHADHLIQAIEQHYKSSKDWEGQLYCGITLKWDYQCHTVDLSMPGYIKAA